MEITVKKIIEEKVKIELPLYRTGGCHAYKVYSEENCISICGFNGMLSIQQQNACLAWTLEIVKDCTKEEFDKMYQEVSSKIAKLL